MKQRCNNCQRFAKCFPALRDAAKSEFSGPVKEDECYDFEPVKDLLTEMFRLQAELNLRYGFKPGGPAGFSREEIDIHDGEWIHNYITAMSSELEELRNCIHWKHWHKEARDGKRFRLHDREHAKVEIIDLFFFWMSLAQAVGLTPDEVFELYKGKLGINHERRDGNMTSEQAHGHEFRV